MKKIIDSKVIYIIIIIIVGFIVYYPSLYGKFMWDDEQQVVNHIYIRSINNIPLFFKGSTFYLKQEHLIGVFYRPLMTSVYALIYPFSSGKPFLYHTVQLTIHVLNTIIFYNIFIFLFGYISNKNKTVKLLSFFSALIFLVHPMNSEVVSYIANMQDVLFFFFGMSGLLIVLYMRESVIKVILSGILIGLSIFSKETGVLFFPLILGYIFLFRKNSLFRYTAFYSLIFVGYMTLRCGIAHMCQGHNGPNPIAKLPFIKYLMQLPAIMFYYIKTFFFPKNVAIGQHWWVRTLNFHEFYIPSFVLLTFFSILITIWLYLNYKATSEKKIKNTALIFSFFCFWLVIGLLMHLHIMPLDFTVADRWFYFSMPAILGILISCLLIFSKRISAIFYFFSIVIIIGLACFTWKRNSYFQNTFNLYIHDNQISPGSFDLENNIGVEYYRNKKYKEARIHFQKSVDISPDWPISVSNLAVTYEREGNYKRAEQYYKLVIKNNVYYPSYLGNVRVLIKQNKKLEASQYIIKALVNFPEDTDLLNYKDELKKSTKAL